MRYGEKQTVLIRAGHVLSVTVGDATTTGIVTRLADSQGDEPFAPTPIAGANLSFGPFGNDRRYDVSCYVGSLTLADALFEPSTGAEGGVTTAIAAAIALLKSAGITFSSKVAGLVFKQGANGLCGTFVANGATQVDVANTNVAITDTVCISLNTAGGTVGVIPPAEVAKVAGTGFSIKAQIGDTSTYNYVIFKNAA